VGRLSKEPDIYHDEFMYQAANWNRKRRVVLKSGVALRRAFSRVGFIVTNMKAHKCDVVHFYNQRGTVEQWLKEGKYALNWTRLSCKRFAADQVRLALFVLAYNLGNFLRRLALPKSDSQWSLRSLQVELVKIVAKGISHSNYTHFRMAEVAVSRELFERILLRINRLRCCTA
jgi:hypothetical protein